MCYQWKRYWRCWTSSNGCIVALPFSSARLCPVRNKQGHVTLQGCRHQSVTDVALPGRSLVFLTAKTSQNKTEKPLPLQPQLAAHRSCPKGGRAKAKAGSYLLFCHHSSACLRQPVSGFTGTVQAAWKVRWRNKAPLETNKGPNPGALACAEQTPLPSGQEGEPSPRLRGQTLRLSGELRRILPSL